MLFEDMLESIHKIESYTEDLTFDDFSNDSMVADAVARNLEIIGEAANRVPDATKTRFPNIP